MSPASNTCEVYCKLPECISHHDVLGNMVFAVKVTKKSIILSQKLEYFYVLFRETVSDGDRFMALLYCQCAHITCVKGREKFKVS